MKPKSIARTWPALGLVALLHVTPARAQVTGAAGYTPPDDTPVVKVGGTIFTDYTYQSEPKALDADMNSFHPSGFNVQRAYINVTGNISHLVGFRITPDITRQSTTGATSNLDGSLTFRLKYAYGALLLDDALKSKGSWVRLGLQQTPWVDYAENVYRYRFQGTIFEDREGFLTSSDFAVSGHYNFPSNYGDVHMGIYNGEGYTKGDANDKKAFQIRGTLRPLPMSENLRGLRVTMFYDADSYLKDGEKKRFVGNVSFEHKYINAGFDWLTAKDQLTATKASTEADGYSIWFTPRSTFGLEGLIRFDSLQPNTKNDDRKDRTIVGVAYWFPVQKGVSAAFLLDTEKVSYDAGLAKPDERRYALHALFNF